MDNEHFCMASIICSKMNNARGTIVGKYLTAQKKYFNLTKDLFNGLYSNSKINHNKAFVKSIFETAAI